MWDLIKLWRQIREHLGRLILFTYWLYKCWPPNDRSKQRTIGIRVNGMLLQACTALVKLLLECHYHNQTMKLNQKYRYVFSKLSKSNRKSASGYVSAITRERWVGISCNFVNQPSIITYRHNRLWLLCYIKQWVTL